MPSTINGIGTHYYGDRNQETRTATCQQCGYNTTLASYDTRLWFVILYIPIIPLGRKRIIDQCAMCQRHWVVKQDEWQMQKQLGVSGAIDRYESDPTPETALEAFAYLLSFRQHDEADKLMMAALERFPDDASLQAGFGLQLDNDGRYEEADKLLQSAYEMRPDLPEARVGMGLLRMREGEPDSAREALAFLEEPGAGQLYDLSPLNALAFFYQQNRKHNETIDICRHLLAEYPDSAQQQPFRNFIKVSERAVRATESILPKKEFSLAALFNPRSGQYESWQRWAAFGVVVAFIVALGLVAHDAYRVRHHRIHVFNSTANKVTMIVDDGDPFSFGGNVELDLAEGIHRIRVTEPTPEEFAFEVETNYFQRWTHKPVWIVNIDNSTAFTFTSVIYSETPRPSQPVIMLGPYHHFPHVDYAFEPPPQSMQIPSGSLEVRKTLLQVEANARSYIVQTALVGGKRDQAFDFAEAAIRRDPNDEALLSAYVAGARENLAIERAEAFLVESMWNEPIAIPLHREYHELVAGNAEHEELLIAKYDEALAADANNPDYLYLRGRLERDDERALEYFQKVIAADPQHGWGWYAIAYYHCARGDWEQAQKAAEQACKAYPESQGFQAMLHETQMGTGELRTLEGKYQQVVGLPTSPNTIPALVNLCEVLVKQGKLDESQRAFDHWAREFPSEYRSDPDFIAIEGLVACITGKVFDRPGGTTDFRLQSYLVHGPPAAAVASVGEANISDPWDLLAVSLAFSIAGEEEAARQWRTRASDVFMQGNRDNQEIGAILSSADPPTADQVAAIRGHATQRALVLVVLSRRFPAESHFSEDALRMNVRRLPPAQLISRALYADETNP